MEQARLLRRIQAHDARALEEAMAQYSGYVYTVVRNRACGLLPPEDLEEVASDVFLALWEHPERVRPGSLQSWLGALARHKTIDRLRRVTPELPLEEDVLSLDGELWQSIAAQERTALVREALGTLSESDRELFLRYYDLCESVAAIAAQMHLSQANVKTRLYRGRKQLKNFLTERGLTDENEIE
jgi:RNA polymerase sigma-70 factor (ECF subfamily)